MNWKLIILGGLVFYVVTMALAMLVTGPLIHEGLLDEDYAATESFWRPELRTDPPDMAALMPMWVTIGIFNALIFAAIYGWLRPALGGGPGWQTGMKYGALLALISALYMLGWSGVFDLPGNIWMWWAIDGLILNLPGGAALGWVGQKFG